MTIPKSPFGPMEHGMLSGENDWNRADWFPNFTDINPLGPGHANFQMGYCQQIPQPTLGFGNAYGEHSFNGKPKY